MYQAIIVRPEVRKHPNADKLTLLCFNGCQVITGATVTPGQLFCFFPEGGQLSDEFLFENSEFRPGKGINKDPTKSGMFDESGRVRCIRLRKEASEGYCVPLSSLAWTGDVSFLKEGDTFDTLNGHTICRKYVTRAVKEAIEKAAKAKRVYFECEKFVKHFDTSNLHEFIGRLPLGTVIYFTEKIHATSGRTARMFIPNPKPTDWWEQLLLAAAGKCMEWIGSKLPMQGKWTTISGSRNVTFNPGSGYPDGYRNKAEAELSLVLHNGETAFYEICHSDENNNPIMHQHIASKEKDEVRQELQKIYGDSMRYRYGLVAGETKIFLYRMTLTTDKGVIEYDWDQLKRRANEMGIAVVPELREPMVLATEDDRQVLLETAKALGLGPSALDKTHMKEGVCIRAQHPLIPYQKSILKAKSFPFKILEGHAKSDESYIDPEEIS